MAVLHVWAHWTLPPRASVPAALAGYGPFPLSNPVVWPPTGTVTPIEVWCAIVKQADLDAAGWGATATPPPPPWPGVGPPNVFDEGLSGTATGFRVTRVRLWQTGADFTYEIITPGGVSLGTVVPTGSGYTTVPLPAPIGNGAGVWRILIGRQFTSAVGAPALNVGQPPPTGVAEPYVSPYGNAFEGLVGLEFTGDEIVVVPPPGVTGTVTIGSCDANAQRLPTTLEVQFAPPLPAGSSYTVTFTSGVAAPATVTRTVPPASPSSASTQASYAPGTYYPTATVVLTLPGQSPTTTVIQFATGGAGMGVMVPACPTVPPGDCYQISLSSAPSSPCIRSGQPAVVTFTATVTPVTPGGPPFTGSIVWQVRDVATSAILPLPAPTPTGTVLSYSFTSPGRFEVTASISQQACTMPIVSDTETKDVGLCDCPTFVGGIVANQLNGCQFNFSVQVSNPTPNTPVITWDFGDGTTGTGTPISHTYPPGTTGSITVTATVTTVGCTQTISTQVNVDCGGQPPGQPPPGQPPPSTPPISPACMISLLLALFLLGSAGVMLSAWGCLGPAGIPLLPPALVAATSGLIALAAWIFFCRNCAAIRFLQRFFSAMAVLFLILSAIFALVAIPGCGLGAAAVAALLGVIAGALAAGAALIGCP